MPELSDKCGGQHYSSVHRLKLTEVIQQLSGRIVSRKYHLQFLHPSAQSLSALTSCITTSTCHPSHGHVCFLLVLSYKYW